jgi:hypothetical protein
MNKALNIRKKQAAAGGLKPIHVTPNTYESIWGFKPSDEAHSGLAIELVSPKRRRTVVISDERRAALTVTLAAARAAKAVRLAA